MSIEIWLNELYFAEVTWWIWKDKEVDCYVCVKLFLIHSYKHCAMLSQLFEMENAFTVSSSDPHPPPAAPSSHSLPLSSSSTSSGTKKQKRTPTYQRSVSQETCHLSLFCFVLKAWLRRATHFCWNNLQTHFLTSLGLSFIL